MKVKNIFLFSFLFVFLDCNLSFANEHGEAPPAGGGGKGGPKDSGLPPWFQAEARIAELSAKIKATEEELKKMIAQKRDLPENSPAVKPLVKNIVKSHKDMEKLIEEFQKNMNLLKYRFPERGQKAERTYQKMELRSVEEMEQAVGIDGKLSRNVTRMRSAYGVKPPKKEDHKSKQPIQKPAGSEKSIEDEAPINLTK